MQNYDNDKLLNIEGWSNQERVNSMSRARVINVIALISSSVLAVAPWIYYHNFPSQVIVFLGVTGIMGMLTAGFTFYYFSQTSQDDILFPDQNEQEAAQRMQSIPEGQQDHILVSMIFTAAGVMMSLYFLAFLFLNFQRTQYEDYLMATNQDAGNFQTKFNVIFSCVVICILLSILSFGYICFALYIACIKQEHMRITIHTFNFLFLLSTFFTLISAKHCLGYLSMKAISDVSDVRYVQQTIYISIMCGLVSLAIYLINMKKFKVTYFLGGSVILVLLFINAAFHFQITRNTIQIRDNLKKDCGNQLRTASESYVQQACNCQKYVKVQGQYSVQCNANQLGVLWEQDVGKDVSLQVNHQACLNMNCCGVLASSYSKWFFALSFFTAAILVFGFGLLSSLYYLSQRPPFINYKLYTQDYGFGLLSLVVIVVGSVLWFSGNFHTLPPKKPMMDQISLTTTPSSEYLTTQSQQIPVQTDVSCYPLVNYLNWKQLQCSNCASDQVIRLSVHADNQATIQQTIQMNSFQAIQQLPSDIVSQQLFSDPNKASSISFQGIFTELQNIIKSYVYLCPSSSGLTNIQMNFYQVPKNIPEVTEQIQLNQYTHMSPPSSIKHQTAHLAITQASLQFVQLNQIQFSNVEIRVHDVNNQKYLGDYLIELRSSGQSYKKIKQLDSNQLVLFNIQLGGYEVLVSKDNYYIFTGKLEVLQTLKPTHMNVYLTPQATKVGQTLITLQWQDPTIQISLAATYNVSPTEECTTGLLTGPCKNMYFSDTSTNKYQSQTISIDSFDPKSYLVYVQYFPNDQDLKQSQYDLTNGEPLTSSQASSFNDTSFFSSNLTLSVYTQGKSQPIMQVKTPLKQLINQIYEPNLTWLALCIDGEQGVNSAQYSQDFWDYTTDPKFNQRPYSDDRTLPLSSICDQYFGNV